MYKNDTTTTALRRTFNGMGLAIMAMGLVESGTAIYQDVTRKPVNPPCMQAHHAIAGNMLAVTATILGPTIFEDSLRHGDRSYRMAMLKYLDVTVRQTERIAKCYKTPGTWAVATLQHYID